MTHENVEKDITHENVEKDITQKMAMAIPGGQSNLLICLFSLSFTHFAHLGGFIF